MVEDDVRTLTIEVGDFDRAAERFRSAFRGEFQGCFHTFPTHELMLKVLTPKRWEVVRTMMGQGPLSIREVARRIGRDIKAVHGDVQALIVAGVIDKTEDGKVEFPYDRIHVDFTIQASDRAA